MTSSIDAQCDQIGATMNAQRDPIVATIDEFLAMIDKQCNEILATIVYPFPFRNKGDELCAQMHVKLIKPVFDELSNSSTVEELAASINTLRIHFNTHVRPNEVDDYCAQWHHGTFGSPDEEFDKSMNELDDAFDAGEISAILTSLNKYFTCYNACQSSLNYIAHCENAHKASKALDALKASKALDALKASKASKAV
jgi:hypothetical protein